MYKHKTSVTICLATYNRPETLTVAVRSVLYQSYTDWKLFVIGDCCDSPTSEAMAPFEEDQRIYYINLSRRSGSQAIPNSVGINLTESPYIAFLNHDDIWLPDHLEIVVKALKNNTSNFYLGSSIFVSNVQEIAHNQLSITKSFKTGPKRKLESCFSDYFSFEPVSSWVIKQELFKKTGLWSSPYNLYRYPSQDWLMRAWRAGAKLVTDSRITSIKVETHLNIKNSNTTYSSPAEMHKSLFKAITDKEPDAIRNLLIRWQSDRAGNSGIPAEKVKKKNRALALFRQYILNLRFFSWLYYHFGIDIDEWLNRIYGKKKGANWSLLLNRRTEEKEADHADIVQMTKEARKILSKKVREKN